MRKPFYLQWMVVVMLLTLMLSGVPTPASAQRSLLQNQLNRMGIAVKEEGGRMVVEATLRQVLKLAQIWNVSLEATKVGEAIAQSVLEASRKRNTPTLTNSVNIDRGISASLFSSGSNFLILNGTDAMSVSSGLSKTTDTGIKYGLTYTEARIRALTRQIVSEGDAPIDGTTAYSWISSSTLKGSVSIPVGQDYGSFINNVPVERSALGLKASRLDTRQRELSLLSATAQTYWDLVAALENQNIKAEAVKLSERLLQENQIRLQAGVLSPFDVQVTEAQLAVEREQLQVARSNLLRIEDLVRALLNLEKVDFSLRPIERPKVRSPKQSQEQLLKAVFQRDTILRQLQNGLEANDLDMREARNKTRADVDFNLYYQLNGYSGSVLGGVEGFTKNKDDSYGVGLTWTVPLFDVKTKAIIQQRTLERKRLELDMSSVKSELNVKLQSVLRQIRLSMEEVETAGISRKLAERQLKNEIERFKVGESTSFQVSQFQQSASEAKGREVFAQVKFERQYLDLLVVTGGLYEAYGLKPAHP